MAQGKVTVNSENLGQGGFTEVERQFLYLGVGTKNVGVIQYINGDSDLDDLLGIAANAIKTQVEKARYNGGENWSCVAIPMAAAADWEATFNYAMAENVVCEAVVVCDAISQKSDFTDMYAAAELARSSLGRRLFFMARGRVFDGENETWATYIAEMNALTDGVVGYRVNPIAEIYPGFLGSIAGRYCNRAVSIADTPMRTEQGGLIDIAELPVDSDDVRFSNAHGKALNDQRWTVPQTYADYDGIYCSDGQMLDAEGGDYQVVENVRVVDKAARRVRILAIKKIGNRALNSTPISIKTHQTYFMRPLIDMSQSIDIGGKRFPGDITPPIDGDIVITWLTKTRVNIFMLARPYNNPKDIGVNIALDLSNNA